MNEKQRPAIKADVAKMALAVLVERLGGSVTITPGRVRGNGAAHGGIRNVGVQAEYRRRVLHLTLFATPQRPPPN